MANLSLLEVLDIVKKAVRTGERPRESDSWEFWCDLLDYLEKLTK